MRRLLLLVLAAAMACGRARTLAVTELDAPAFLSRGAGDAALSQDPESGDLFLAWVAGDSAGRHVYFARSSDGGSRWSVPSQVTESAGDVGAPHGEAAPRIVAGGQGRIAVVWSRSMPVPGRKWPASAVRFARSLDGGARWSEALTLNDDSAGAPATHTFHGATWTGDGGLVAAWLDERGSDEVSGHHHAAAAPGADPATMPATESDARIYMAASGDFGESWEPNRKVWGAVCPCCRVALARSPSGGVVTAWRQHLPENVRDVVTATLLPAAADPRRVHADDWQYPGCPHTGPALAVDSAGVRHVAWYTGKPNGAGVYYARADSAGQSLGAAVPLVTAATVQTAHPSAIALGDGGALVAMDVSEDGLRAIRLVRIGAGGQVVAATTVAGSAGSTYPQVVRAGQSAALVAWTTHNEVSSSVRLARVALD